MLKNMDVRCNRLVFSFLFLFILSGCAGLGKPVQEPQVTLVDMQMLEVKPLEAIFQISLRVMNPNEYPLAMQGLNCDLKIDGKHFATGLANEPQKIPAFGTGVIPVTVYASTLKMFTSVMQIVQQVDQQRSGMQPLRYELTGKIRVGGGLNQSVPFHTKGELNLDGRGR
ncbi:MAG: LEA type 2 family protein [Desulfobulbaceae bacterium]|nr:LEA type 2 family protein [Desulfobulbaceae bacterium]